MSEKLSYDIVDARYRLQAQWTKPFREFLYRKLNEKECVYILEVGCGTGAVIRAVGEEFRNPNKVIFGLDSNYKITCYAKNQSGGIFLTGNGEELPFRDDLFDLVFCHYLLLWTENPVKIIAEMRRVLKHQGIAAAIAEPCYAEMTAAPDNLYKLAAEQRNQLREAGSNINVGCELGNIFKAAGFSDAQIGIYQSGENSQEFIRKEVDQMLMDTGRKQFCFEQNKEYSYSVPTYYCFAKKQ